MTTCGFCSGRGWVLGRAYDREGRAQEPPRVWCDYCDGSGACDRGEELEPAKAPTLGPDHAADLARAGLPPWA